MTDGSEIKGADDLDKSKVEQGVKSSPAVDVRPAELEQKEIESSLSGVVDQECKNPNGLYIGLKKSSREFLGVKVGEPVEICDKEGNLIGIYTVGEALKELTKVIGSFSANNIAPGTFINVKRCKESREKAVEYTVDHGIEKDEEKTKRRMDIIKERFPQASPECFITIPTSLSNQLTGEIGKIAKIAVGKIHFDGKDYDVVFVPSGTNFGLTTKAAELLNIPQELKKIKLKTENGILYVA